MTTPTQNWLPWSDTWLYMDVLALRRQGLTIAEIANETGYHPATISKWLAAGSPPARRETEALRLLD